MPHVLKIGKSWLVRSDGNRVLSVHKTKKAATSALSKAKAKK